MAVILDITISLDGFVTAPNAGPDNGLGDDGLALHAWAIGDRTPEDLRILSAATEATGAVVMGRNTFDVVDGPGGWNDDRHYGADQGEVPPPCFVVTHEAPAHVRIGWLRSVYNIFHAFSTNCFIDEIAVARGADCRDVMLEVLGPARQIKSTAELGVEQLRNYGAPLQPKVSNK